MIWNRLYEVVGLFQRMILTNIQVNGVPQKFHFSPLQKLGTVGAFF